MAGDVTWAPARGAGCACRTVVAIFALLELRQSLQWFGLMASISILAFLALVLYFIGAGLMVWARTRNGS